MKMGTKSLLYGAHAFWLHPFMVAIGWWRLYGFPWDPRLWFCFFFHDIGYWGSPNMDGEEGERHPYLGAIIVSALFDGKDMGSDRWLRFSAFHSRSYSRMLGEEPSRLCWADKMGVALTPRWLYVPCVLLTGEWREYRDLWEESGREWPGSVWRWFTDLKKVWRRKALEGSIYGG